MATKTALDILRNGYWTMKWTLPRSGRARAVEVEPHSLNLGPCEWCCASTAEIGHEPGIVHGQAFRGIGFDFEEGRAFGC